MTSSSDWILSTVGAIGDLLTEVLSTVRFALMFQKNEWLKHAKRFGNAQRRGDAAERASNLPLTHERRTLPYYVGSWGSESDEA